MQEPKMIQLKCVRCEQPWEMSLEEILKEERTTIYRGEKAKTRSVTCPNCGKDVKVEIPAEWLDE